MKKLIILLIIPILFTSCWKESNYNDIDEKTEFPTKVLKSINDTTLQKQYAVVETQETVYLLTKGNTDKVWFVDKTIQRNRDVEFGAGILFAAITMFFGILIGVRIGEY